jgi:hypothetical protein
LFALPAVENSVDRHHVAAGATIATGLIHYGANLDCVPSRLANPAQSLQPASSKSALCTDCLSTKRLSYKLETIAVFAALIHYRQHGNAQATQAAHRYVSAMIYPL